MMGEKTGSAAWTLNRIYMIGSVLLMLAVTACATAPGSSPQARIGLTHPTAYCDHILIGGDLGVDVAHLDQPASCGRQNDKNDLPALKLDAVGQIDDALPRSGNQFTKALILTVELYDMPLTFGILPPPDPEKVHVTNVRHIVPALEKELSSTIVRIDEIATIDMNGDILVCVIANKAVLLDRILNIDLCRRIDAAASPEAIAALARSIVKNDLTQIDAKE